MGIFKSFVGWVVSSHAGISRPEIDPASVCYQKLTYYVFISNLLRGFGYPNRPDLWELTGGPQCKTQHFIILIITLRVQVPNNHILTQNLYYTYNHPKPKYLIIGYLGPYYKDRQKCP